jgi:YVTN family beta-propeller protein
MRLVRRKQLLSTTALTILVLGLSACTGSGSDASPTSPPPVVDAVATGAADDAPEPSPSAAAPWQGVSSAERRFEEVARLTGGLTPKSVVASPTGDVVAQNMIYTHTISVYDREREKITTIQDRITPADFGYRKYTQPVQGGPVEASFAPDGKHLWVSNYSMYGPGFHSPGDDVCSPASGHDRSFLYRIDTTTWEIDGATLVGSVPKYVQATPDGKHVLVTNWCSYDVSVVDTATLKQIARIPVGRYPRGIVVTADSSKAYIAVMGSTNLRTLDLDGVVDGERGASVVTTFSSPGRAPRHLNLSPDGKRLYVTLNGVGEVAKLDARTGRVLATVRTGQAPRSAALSPDGTALFVVNYESDTVSRLRTSDMKVLESRHVDHHPIGITYNPVTHEVWVCSYIGAINVLADAER